MPEDMGGLLLGVEVGSRWPEIKKTNAVLFSLPGTTKRPATMQYPENRLDQINMKIYEK
jgi:hypothetical protein